MVALTPSRGLVSVAGLSVSESADPLPLDGFLDRYLSVGALLEVVKNRQNTSTRGGILKADAALRYAAVLCEHEVTTVDEARTLLTDGDRLDAVEAALRQVPGEGGSGVRRGYLWMLIGDQDTVQPDRIVLRWLTRHCADATPDSARGLLRDIARTAECRLRSVGHCVGGRSCDLAGRPAPVEVSPPGVLVTSFSALPRSSDTVAPQRLRPFCG